MRIVITGAHLSPAIAVAEKLKKDGHEIIFIGRKYALEGDNALSFDYQIIVSEGFKFKNLITGRLQRKYTRYTIPSLIKIPVGLIQALLFLIDCRPYIILSFGGYTSLPVVVAGFMLGIPTVVHEQTLGAGLANKIAALFARKVLISWKSSKKFFPKDKTILTGNPIREEIFEWKMPVPLRGARPGENGKLKIEEKLPIVYITGGSLGSHIINITVEKIIKKLLKSFVVIHQTGDSRKYKDFERLSILKENLDITLKERYFLTKYVNIKDIGWVLNNSSLVVGRAGMNTVCELLALKKKALLIPLPFSQDKEQMQNAKLLKSIGLARIIAQDRLNSRALYNLIKTIMKKKVVYNKNIDTNTFTLAQKKIVEIIYEEFRGKRAKKEK